jgi:catechol 2,3-dioxygenase-like lactoylglutathione lyase family enzyme
MIKGIHHTSLTVSDMERSKAFYVGLLGMELMREAELSGPAIEEIVGLKEARMKLAFIRKGSTILELFQYISPSGRNDARSRRPCDVGVTHVAFEVRDIEAVYQELRSQGVEFVSPPRLVRTSKAAYLFDPDGITLEIFEPLG